MIVIMFLRHSYASFPVHLYFEYVISLLQRYIQQYNEVELSALGMGMLLKTISYVFTMAFTHL